MIRYSLLTKNDIVKTTLGNFEIRVFTCTRVFKKFKISNYILKLLNQYLNKLYRSYIKKKMTFCFSRTIFVENAWKPLARVMIVLLCLILMSLFPRLSAGDETGTPEAFRLERDCRGLGRRVVTAVYASDGQHQARGTGNRLFHQLSKSNYQQYFFYSLNFLSYVVFKNRTVTVPHDNTGMAGH